MDYVRDHIKKYSIYIYGRTIGIALLLFALLFTIVVVSITLIGIPNLNINSVFLITGLLFGFSILIIIINVINAHHSIIKLMNKKEHMIHSKNVGIWYVILIITVIILLLPLSILNTHQRIITLLFSLGGILLILYLSIGGIFKHYFHELIFAGAALWIIFGISAFYSNSVPYVLEYFITLTSLLIIFGISGIAIIFNSSQSLIKDYISLTKKSEVKNQHK